MNELGRIRNARADGYSDGFAGLPSAGWALDWPDQKENYDQGYQDGQVIRAVRTGDLSGLGPRVAAFVKPRLMVAGDLAEPGDDCAEFLREAELRKMKENAYYFLQYYLACEDFKIPDAYAEIARELFDTEREVKVLTGIVGDQPGLGKTRTIGKSAVLGMGYDPASRPDKTVVAVVDPSGKHPVQFEGVRTGKWSGFGSGAVRLAADFLGATPTDIPGLWNVPGAGELSAKQMISLAAERQR